MLSKRKNGCDSLIHLFKIRADFITVNIRIYRFSAMFFFLGIISAIRDIKCIHHMVVLNTLNL